MKLAILFVLLFPFTSLFAEEKRKWILSCVSLNEKGELVVGGDVFALEERGKKIYFAKGDFSIKPEKIFAYLEVPKKSLVSDYKSTYIVLLNNGKKGGFATFYANLKTQKGYAEINLAPDKDSTEQNTEGLIPLKCEKL